MGFLWFSTGFLWVFYGFLWVFYGFSMVFLWVFYGFSMVFLWFFCGFPSVGWWLSRLCGRFWHVLAYFGRFSSGVAPMLPSNQVAFAES